MTPKQFIFESYGFDRENGVILLKYSLDGDIRFEERLELPSSDYLQVPEALLERALFNLHLIGGVSYYKAYCPGEIVVKSGELSKKEAEFWNKLYTQGLGEFFYKNKVNFNNLVKFPYGDGNYEALSFDLPERSLVPIGGGKDSMVSIDLMKRAGMEFELFNLGGCPLIWKLCDIVGQEPIVVERKLAEELFKLNKEGAMNGHVPISAYIGFVTVLLSLLYGYKYIVLSNERSANIGNVKYLGMEINHQYSKSFEFEKDFHEYVQDFICPDIYYFSLLRPMSELKIAQHFSHLHEYFDHFTSCNRNFKILNDAYATGSLGSASVFWCGKCPKCLFVYTILSPFIKKKDLNRFFGKDLLADESLKALLAELLGKTEVKPFECVGTPEEVRWALERGDESDLFSLNDEHLLPDEFWPVIQQRYAAIVGFGVEGRATKEFLEENNHKLEIDVLDIKDGPDYLDTLAAYDLIVKSPGVKWSSDFDMVADRVTSSTQIFFHKIDPSNKIIAITGSKGKSTVATLIHMALKAAGRKSKLVGNIGEAAIKYVDEKGVTFVMELSSYQLERLNARPHIAVFTSFFPDHLDVHGNMGNYLAAKSKITANQHSDDYFVYPAKYPELGELETKAKKIDVKAAETAGGLLGQHNLENVGLVTKVLELMEVDLSFLDEVLKNFTGLPHRLEFVGEFRGVKFVDDAIATTPEATLAAIDVYKDEIGCIFLGGADRKYEFEELVTALDGIPNIVFFPDTGVQIKALYKGDARLFEAETMEKAVRFAYEFTEKGKVVLLSTASPSYSMYKNFKEQGDEFQKYVKLLV